jgi:hypothetical protein
MKLRVIALACVGAALLNLGAAAAFSQDDVLPLIDKGKKAVADGDYQTAVSLFQQVVQQLQTKLGGAMERFLPKPPSGWTAGEVEAQSWTGTSSEASHAMTNISREYRRESDDARCTINITNWPTMVQGLRQTVDMYKNMQSMMRQDPEREISFDEKDGWTIMRMVDKVSKSSQMQAVSETYMVSVDLNRDDSAAVDAFLGGLDLAGLARGGR